MEPVLNAGQQDVMEEVEQLLSSQVLSEIVPRSGAANFKHSFRVLLLGHSQSGKTSLFQRVVQRGHASRAPADTAELSVGLELGHRSFLAEDGCDVWLQIWDTASGSHLDTLLSDYLCPGSAVEPDAVLLCADPLRTEALSTAERWLNLIRLKNPSIMVLLCMTKADLLDPCEVPEGLRRLAASERLGVVCCSVAHPPECDCCVQAFQQLASALYRRKEKGVAAQAALRKRKEAVVSEP
eukprot:RCo040674